MKSRKSFLSLPFPTDEIGFIYTSSYFYGGGAKKCKTINENGMSVNILKVPIFFVADELQFTQATTTI